MIKYHPLKNSRNVMEISEGSINRQLDSVDVLMDFFGDCYVHDCVAMIIHKSVFDDRFFDLKTGLAGEILQKMSTYNMKLAIVGNFLDIESKSKSLRDFIRESNERKFINFLATTEEALAIFNS